jgi:hypothetical protein
MRKNRYATFTEGDGLAHEQGNQTSPRSRGLPAAPLLAKTSPHEE